MILLLPQNNTCATPVARRIPIKTYLHVFSQVAIVARANIKRNHAETPGREVAHLYNSWSTL